MTDPVVPDIQRGWVLHAPGDLRLEELPVRRPDPDEVLVRVSAVGVCGTDKHLFHEGRDSSKVVTDPLVIGHEFGGRIVAVGKNIDPARIGQRVSVEPLMPNWGSREARMGRYNLDPDQLFCGNPGYDGGLQEYVPITADNAHPVPDGVSDSSAAMVEPISVALSGVDKAEVSLGGRVLITGAGPIGLFAAQLSIASGAGEVHVVEPRPSRQKAAAALGATVHPSLEEAPSDVDSLIECTGVAVVRHDGFFHVRPGGRVVFIGVGDQDANVPMLPVIEREVTLHGVMRYHFTWPRVIAMLAAHRIQTDSLVTAEIPFEDALREWTQPDPDEIKTIIRIE